MTPRDVAPKVERRLEPAVGIAEEVQLGDADDLRRRRLLGTPRLGHHVTRDVTVEPTRIPIGHDAVHDLDAGVGPRRDAAGAPEVDIVGVRGHDEDALDAFVDVGLHGVVGHVRRYPPATPPDASLNVLYQGEGRIHSGSDGLRS